MPASRADRHHRGVPRFSEGSTQVTHAGTDPATPRRVRMTTSSTGREAPRLAGTTEHQRVPEFDFLNSLIGKWMTVGETIPTDGAPGLGIHASDIYEWVPGGFFVVHTAYGSIGDSDVGGIEMIGYDAEVGRFRTYFFDSQGVVSNQDLTIHDGTWTWSGAHARATGVLGDDGRTMPTLHEWSDDGVNWHPSMNVTLRKIV
jgi:Protein of unknown function (DUF1579)